MVILSAIVGIFFSTGFIPALQSQTVERDVVYRVHQGANLSMDLYFPEPRAARTPLIVYIHGGGWYSGDKASGTGLKDIPLLVKRGYIVASINYRLAPRYKFPAQIEDAGQAVSFLRTKADQYGIDPERIGVMGESAGGQLASLLGLTEERQWSGEAGQGTIPSTRVQAVVDMYGPADLEMKFEQNWSMLAEHVFNTSDPQSEILRRASPLTYVSQEAPPFLVIHGDKDDEVRLDQSQAMYSKLISAGTPAELIVVKNAGHEFIPQGGPMSPTRAEISLAIADFFDRYLR